MMFPSPIVKVRNIIHVANSRKIPARTQSHRRKVASLTSISVFTVSFGGFLCSHRITPIAVIKKNRFPQSIGEAVFENMYAIAYVHQLLSSMPQRNADASRCGMETKG